MFAQVFADIESYVSLEEANELLNKAVLRVLALSRIYKCAFGWSGGKDSLALQVICERANVLRGVLGMASNLSFSTQNEWFKRNTPEYVKTYDFKMYDINWLSQHLSYLFPYPNKNDWSRLIHIEAQNRFCKTYGIDTLILGRRIQDGNFCGKEGVYTRKDGVTVLSPIYDWKHEDVLAVIRYFSKLQLMPTFYASDGWTHNTTYWPDWCYVQDKSEGWKRVYDIEPNIVINASRYIQSAKEFLLSK